MLNRPFIEKWANELPNYGQGQKFLQPSKDKYCCLGVACELYRQETGQGEWVKSEFDRLAFKLDGVCESSHLPIKVAEYIGVLSDGCVPQDSGYYKYDVDFRSSSSTAISIAYSLITLNDVRGQNFEKIKSELLKMLENVGDEEWEEIE